MSSATSLQALVERYLLERRRLGFALRSPAYALRSFARHIHAIGHRGPLTVELMADWARCDSHGSSDPRTWARRLKQLHPFTRWLQQFEPRTELPDDAILSDPCPSDWRRTSTASRRSLICSRLRGDLGRRRACVGPSSRHCSV